jgi:imidazolonepropionase-like amidohydrolase
MRQDHLRSFALAREAGVKIAMGTDIGGYGYGDTALELELLVEAGMTPAEAIATSTRRSAECMRLDGEIGALEAGKRADLLVVDGDPLADISILRKRESLALVMKDGVGYAGPLMHAVSGK